MKEGKVLAGLTVSVECTTTKMCSHYLTSVSIAMVNYVTAAQFLRAGLEPTNYNANLAVEDRRMIQPFQLLYPVQPETCSAIFSDLQTPEIDGVLIENPTATNQQKTVRRNRWCSHITKRGGLTYKLPLAVFDCSEKTVRRNIIWCCHITKRDELTYQLPLAVNDDKGPDHVSTLAITVFCEKLKKKIPKGKLAIGDSAYEGEPDGIATSSAMDSNETSQFMNRALARHAAFIERLEEFGVLRHEFRDSIEKHKAVCEALYVIAQYEIDCGRPLFKL